MGTAQQVQHLFLQAVLSRRILSQQLAAKIWEKCVEIVDPDQEFTFDRAAWDAWVNTINQELNPLDLEFAHAPDEVTGKDMYGMVNRKEDEIAKMATEYSAVEIAFFKAVIEQIMLAPHESYCVSSLQALREVPHLKTTMSKAHAEVVLSSFVARGWLLRSKRGRFSLSTRTLLELQTYLRQTYPEDLLECTICMEILTRGVACATPACKARLHTHCYASYKKARNPPCPNCGDPWADENRMKPVGEAAYREGQDKLKRKTRVVEDDGEGEAEGDAEVDQSQALAQTPPRTQARKDGKVKEKGKGKKKAVQVESDEDDMYE